MALDARQKVLYRAFRIFFRDHIAYRKKQAPGLVTEDWAVSCYDNPEAFVRTVELNFPTWDAFAEWLKDVRQRTVDRKKWFTDEMERLTREGLGQKEIEWLKNLDRSLEDENGQGRS